MEITIMWSSFLQLWNREMYMWSSLQTINIPNRIPRQICRNIWTRNISRRSQSGELWHPNNDSSMCSDHFGPTPSNPYPTLHMGHKGRVVIGRQPPKDICSEIPTKERKSTIQWHWCWCDKQCEKSFDDYVEYCDTCLYKEDEIRKLKDQIRCITLI